MVFNDFSYSIYFPFVRVGMGRRTKLIKWDTLYFYLLFVKGFNGYLILAKIIKPYNVALIGINFRWKSFGLKYK